MSGVVVVTEPVDEKYLRLIRERPFAGIGPVTRGMPERPITIGFDIETVNGVPYVMGASSEHFSGDGLVVDVESGLGLETLLGWFKALGAADRDKRKTVIAGAHRMAFDLGCLLWHWMVARGAKPQEIGEQITAHVLGGRLDAVLGDVCFATYHYGNRTIHFIDTWAYFKTSLQKAVADLGLGEVKTDFHGRFRADWGTVRYPLDEIGPYCLQDAKMVRLLLDQIVTWWQEYGIKPAISAPQMSARVFQKHFVTERWVRVPKPVRTAAMLSYHGGRNLFVGEAGWYKNLNAYDVNSAYTWAMTQMPDMTRGDWRAMAKGPSEPGTWGFVCVTGTLPTTRLPVVYTHDFQPIPGGTAVKDLWITSMEYDLLRELVPDWLPEAASSLLWWPDQEDEPSDLARYAQTMWDRRQAATNPVEKTLRKLLANSLYGKFIARSPDIETGGFYAGALFYPPIASWITGMVRCRVMRSEFAFDVLHTATDGVMTTRSMPSSSGLGDMKFENAGPALIFRNKLYLHWNEAGALKKHATHGFQGSLKDLLRFVRGDDPSYTRNRLRGWGEARRDEAVPFAPVALDMTLHTDPAVWARMRREAQEAPYRDLIDATLQAA